MRLGRGPFQQRWLVQVEGVHDRTGGRSAWPGRALSGGADRRSARPSGCTSSSAPGWSSTAAGRSTGPSSPCSPTRPTIYWSSTRARWSRWCSCVVHGRGHPDRPARGPVRRGGLSGPGRPVRIDVFTIFPDLVDRFCAESLLGRARAAGLLDLRCHDLRDHTTDVHRTVDDAPFGGGAGMVLRPEPVFAAVEAAAPAPAAVPPRPRRPSLRPGAGPGAGRRRRASACCAGATRASTTGCATTSSTASCRSATTCSPAARWRPAW